uniref:Putative secreted peptide n=1 Tax=Anopheles braziliensis TaxID=58242 RepID=A0A2M3ZTI1_9DIPT
MFAVQWSLYWTTTGSVTRTECDFCGGMCLCMWVYSYSSNSLLILLLHLCYHLPNTPRACGIVHHGTSGINSETRTIMQLEIIPSTTVYRVTPAMSTS